MVTRTLPTPEELRQLLDYDPETGALTWKVRTPDMPSGPKATREANRLNKKLAGKPASCRFTNGYGRVCIDRTGYLAHRVAWAIANDKWPDGPLDHINGKKTDNRLANLRLTTPIQNSRNRAINRNNMSGCSGVIWRERDGRWQASIRERGKTIHLGYFVEKFDAVLTRLLAERNMGFTMRHGTAA